MAMSSGGSNIGGVMAEINVTPLVDVMLVLLIIFMITAPLLAHKIQIDLPQAAAKPNTETPQPAMLSVKKTSDIYCNDQPPMRSAADDPQRLHEAQEAPPA